MNNPVDFRQFFFVDVDGGEWRVYYYQYPWAFARNAVVACGRNVGKSDSMEKDALYWAFQLPNRETLIATQGEVYLKPRCDRLYSLVESHPFFSLFKGRLTRSPFYSIEIFNHTIYGRAAGTKPGSNFLGPHVDKVDVDEAQELEIGCDNKLQQAVRDGAKCIWRYWGVHDGRRDTALYRHQYEDPRFASTAFRIPSYFRPSWSRAEGEMLARQYGGANSPDWMHQVEGLPGEVAYGVWPYEDLLGNMSKDRQLVEIVINFSDLSEVMPRDEAQRTNRPWFSLEALNLPPPPFGYTKAVAGMDATYTGDPAVILPAFYDKGRWEVPFRIQLRGIIPNDQSHIIRYLLDLYRFDFLALDCTGAEGKNVRDNLSDTNKIYSVIFSSNVVVGYDEGGKEREVYAKEFSTLQGLTRLKNREFLIYESASLLDEFLNERGRRGQGGRIIYSVPKKRGDHTISAFRCLNMAIWTLTEGPEAPREEEIYIENWGELG